MSIDHHFYVPAGMRDSETRKFSEFKYYSAREMSEIWQEPTEYQVFLAHSTCIWHSSDGKTRETAALIDEQYYFEDVEDARWFFHEGYKRMLYEGEPAPDRMELWIGKDLAGYFEYDALVKPETDKKVTEAFGAEEAQ